MPLPPMIETYANRRMAALIGLGFASGLPLMLVNDTLAAWLSSAGIDVKAIGLFSLITIPYALKFFWAPLMDRFVPPLPRGLGRRRGWLLLTQSLLVIFLAGLAFAGPSSTESNLTALAILGTAIVFLSASQDIVADAYRTDVLHERELGAGAAVFVTGYRIAMIVGGSFALLIAGTLGWPFAYGCMAGLFAIGIATTLLAPEPPEPTVHPHTLREAVVEPIASFVRKRGVQALLIGLFIILFKLPDIMAARMTMPLLLSELQFTPEQVGWIRQFIGFFITIIGALIGGGIIARFGMMKSLIIFGLLQAASNAGFFVLTEIGRNTIALGAVIAVESFCGGLVTAGFVAFLMSCCQRRYSATQYALLTSLMALATSLGGAITGHIVDAAGYQWFFFISILAGIPGMALLPWVTGAARPAPDVASSSPAKIGQPA